MLLIRNLFKYLTVFTVFQFCRTGIVDYFGGEFDESDNCKKDEEGAINKLIKDHRMNQTGNCWTTTIESPRLSHLECFSHLTNEIHRRCGQSISLVKTLGKPLYCQKRGVMNCCYNNFECVKTKDDTILNEQGKKISAVLEEYTKYGFDILPDLWAYKHRFRICKKTSTPMDNNECAKVCQLEEKGDFARKCSKNKNLFKCCITKENILCDSCHFCCILPVCSVNATDPVLRDIKFNTNVTLTPKIDSSTKAIEIKKYMKKMTRSNRPDAEMQFFIRQKFCIKPADQFSTTVEHLYNMTEYRGASTKKEMKAVSSYAIDKNRDFFIPETRKLYATKHGPYIYQESFKFDKCYNSEDQLIGLDHCSNKCEKLEQSHFAKKCNKKKNSVFKCCIRMIDIGVSEKIQTKILKKRKKSVKRYCTKNKCNICCVLSICTSQNSDNKIVDKMVRDFPDPAKYSNCITIPKDGGWELLNMTQFKFAYTKDEYCNVESTSKVKINISKSCGKKGRKESRKNKNKRRRKNKYKHKYRKKEDSKKSRMKKSRHVKKMKRKTKSKKKKKRGRQVKKKKKGGESKKKYRTESIGIIDKNNKTNNSYGSENNYNTNNSYRSENEVEDEGPNKSTYNY